MILVTGANGLVGSFICRVLLREKMPFVAMRRAGSDTSLLNDLAEQITWVEADLSDLRMLDEIIQNVEGIIHCAGLVSFSRKEFDLLQEVNVEGTANLINAAIAAGNKRFVHISSVAALGRNPKMPQMDESAKWIESPHNTEYAKSKHLAELEVNRGQAEGVKTVVVNPSFVLGPGDWNRSSTRVFKYVYEGNRYYTKGMMNYVDARDVADAVIGLYRSEIEGERFILSAGSSSYKAFFEKIAEAFGVKPPNKLATPFLSRIAYWGDSIRSLLTGSKPLITSETRRMSGLSYTYEGSKICRSLDFKYRDFDESIRWVCGALEASK